MIYVMQIVNTHGIRGEVKALHYTDGETFFKKVKTVYKENGEAVKILSWKFHKGSTPEHIHINAVALQTRIVSRKTDKICTSPCFTG